MQQRLTLRLAFQFIVVFNFLLPWFTQHFIIIFSCYLSHLCFPLVGKIWKDSRIGRTQDLETFRTQPGSYPIGNCLSFTSLSLEVLGSIPANAILSCYLRKGKPKQNLKSFIYGKIITMYNRHKWLFCTFCIIIQTSVRFLKQVFCFYSYYFLGRFHPIVLYLY